MYGHHSHVKPNQLSSARLHLSRVRRNIWWWRGRCEIAGNSRARVSRPGSNKPPSSMNSKYGGLERDLAEDWEQQRRARAPLSKNKVLRWNWARQSRNANNWKNQAKVDQCIRNGKGWHTHVCTRLQRLEDGSKMETFDTNLWLRRETSYQTPIDQD